MKKNSIFLYAMTLIIAFCFTPSMMAKKISYMGYQYNGKINKENIPEGKGTITMSVLDLLDQSKMTDFSIRGIFNGPIVTDAFFATTWLSYKGEMEIKEGNSFILKKGGVITTNAYDFYYLDAIRPEKIKHHDITLDEDIQINYLQLATVRMPCLYPFPKVPSELNPPSEMTTYVKPSINKALVWESSHVDHEIETIYYNIGEGSNFFVQDIYKDSLINIRNPFSYKDSEGRIWKFEEKWLEERLIEVDYPDGSFCHKDLNFERVHRHYVPKLKKNKNGSIILDERIDNKPIHLSAINERYKNWDRYFLGVDSLLQIDDGGYGYTDLYLTFDYGNILRESDVDKIDNFENMIKDKLLPNIFIPKDKELIINCYGDNVEKVKVISVKNGVILGRKQIAAAEKKAQQAEDAKEQAAYNQLCQKYGKKYVDAFKNGDVIVGMPEGLIKKSIHKIKSQSATSKTYYLLPYYGAPDIKRTATVFVNNGRVTGFVVHR